VIELLIAAISWQYLRAAPLVGLLMLVLTVASILQYWPQFRRLRRAWRIVLLGLRLCGLMALGVSFLQPVISRPPAPAEKGAIVFVIDHSHSMGVVDRQRRPAQLVALADGLGRLPPGVRTHGDEIGDALRKTRGRLDDLTTAQSRIAFAALSGRSTSEATDQLYAMFPAFDAQAASLIAWQSSLKPKSPIANSLANLQKQIEGPRDPAHLDEWLSSVRAALDIGGTASETFQAVADETLYNTNPQVRSICDALKKLSRLGLVEQAMVQPDTGLLASLPSKSPLFGFAAGEEVMPIALRRNGQPIRRLLLDTEPATTDLASVVRNAIDTLSGVPIDSVVLFSDGRRAGRDAVSLSPDLAQPVYVVASTPEMPSQDWSLSHVSIPAGIRIGEELVIRARVHGEGVRPGASTEVRCAIDPAPSGNGLLSPSTQLQRVVLGANLSADFEFVTTISVAGPHRIVLQLPEAPGEITSENNFIERWIKVYPQKLRAALIANSPGWDFRYLRGALAARSGVALYEEVIEDDSCSLSPERILQQDVIVLFDVAASALDARQWNAVHSLLSEKGGLLLMVAGTEHLPGEYSNPLTQEFLPYAVDRVDKDSIAASSEKTASWHIWAGEAPVYHFLPVNSGSHSPNSLSPPGAEFAYWNTVPPLFSYLEIPAIKPFAKPLMIERDTGSPVVTLMPVGIGKSILIGLDETWRWRRRIADVPQSDLCLALIDRYTTKPFAATTADLSLDIGKAALASGESTEVRVKSNSASAIASTRNFELRVLQGEKVVRSQSLSASSSTSNEAVGTLMGLSAGTYRIEVTSDQESIEYPLHVIDQYGAELEEASGDRASLERIARTSGGRVFSLEQLRDLPPLLRAAANIPRSVTIPLWDSSYLFVFVVACFTAEWALRKRLGLA
jgi:hypothetical protein